MQCELAKLLDLPGECSLYWADHHIISRQKVRGNKEAWRLIDKKYQHIFKIQACSKHHQGKESWEWTRKILQAKTKIHGTLYIERVLNEICDTSKTDSLREFRPPLFD